MHWLGTTDVRQGDTVIEASHQSTAPVTLVKVTSQAVATSTGHRYSRFTGGGPTGFALLRPGAIPGTAILTAPEKLYLSEIRSAASKAFEQAVKAFRAKPNTETRDALNHAAHQYQELNQ